MRRRLCFFYMKYFFIIVLIAFCSCNDGGSDPELVKREKDSVENDSDSIMVAPAGKIVKVWSLTPVWNEDIKRLIKKKKKSDTSKLLNKAELHLIVN